jgi:hypothetical protein
MKHLREARVSYCTHFWHALGIAARLSKATAQVIIHAIYPDVFTTSATDEMRSILRQHNLWQQSRPQTSQPLVSHPLQSIQVE